MVYVDDMKAEYHSKRLNRKLIMCHMIADTEEELRIMAGRIGVARRWYQGDHYDICQSKRVLAVQYGAKEVSQRQLGMISFNKKRVAKGLPPITRDQWAEENEVRI